MDTLEEYLGILEDIIVPDFGDILDFGSKFNPVRNKIVGVFLAVQTAGLGISYVLERTFGIDKWMEASNTMFRSRTPFSEIPLFGGAFDLIPNPLGIGEVLFDSGKLIGEHISPGDVSDYWYETVWPNAMFLTHRWLYRDRLHEADHGEWEH